MQKGWLRWKTMKLSLSALSNACQFTIVSHRRTMRVLQIKWSGRLPCDVLLPYVRLRWHDSIHMQIIKLFFLLLLVFPCLSTLRFIVDFILVNTQLRYALSNLGFSGGKRLVRGVSFGFEGSSGGQSRRLSEFCGHAESQLVRSHPELSFDMFLGGLCTFHGGREIVEQRDEQQTIASCSMKPINER